MLPPCDDIALFLHKRGIVQASSGNHVITVRDTSQHLTTPYILQIPYSNSYAFGVNKLCQVRRTISTHPSRNKCP